MPFDTNDTKNHRNGKFEMIYENSTRPIYIPLTHMSIDTNIMSDTEGVNEINI